MRSKTITRFAPSPTGFLHIGGARTALFNWLFAKHMGGEFHLRIEDTDKTRSTPEATQAILDGMDWLNLNHDGEIVYQSHNVDMHITTAHALLKTGAAYRCYCTAQELEAIRAHNLENNSGEAFRSPYRDTTEILDKPYTIRFRVPDGETVITDHVQGKIKWDNKSFDDLVLLRADGTPTYMLAVVVDDHTMGITHVIRGDDHLINAGRQTLIYQALGWDIPAWAHVPLIHGPDGKKLSKRHGALAVQAYREMGYLPDGLRNYLLKLGWSQGDHEIFFDDDAVKLFDLEGINSAPARLDFEKMDYINAQHIMASDDSYIMNVAKPFLTNAIGSLNPQQQKTLLTAIPTLKPRLKTLKDLPIQAAYLFLERPLIIEGKKAKPLRKDGAIDHIRALTLRLKSLNSASWNAVNIYDVFKDYAAAHDVGFGQFGQPLRAALTGGHPSPDLADVLALLGREETLIRLDDAVKTDWKKD